MNIRENEVPRSDKADVIAEDVVEEEGGSVGEVARTVELVDGSGLVRCRRSYAFGKKLCVGDEEEEVAVKVASSESRSERASA
jgi:hypothetical protein